jgi:hypothetical protein
MGNPLKVCEECTEPMAFMGYNLDESLWFCEYCDVYLPYDNF